MGASVLHLWSSFWPKKEHRIVMWGLFNSGKTTILYTQLKNCGPVNTVPTIGFNVESVVDKDKNFLIYDIGGTNKLRPTCRAYLAQTAAVIFVVDSTEIVRLGDAAYELRYLFDYMGNVNCPLLVFANKQDLEGAMSSEEISKALRLGELGDRKWNTIACSAVDGTGIAEGMDWLVQTLRSEKA